MNMKKILQHKLSMTPIFNRCHGLGKHCCKRWCRHVVIIGWKKKKGKPYKSIEEQTEQIEKDRLGYKDIYK